MKRMRRFSKTTWALLVFSLAMIALIIGSAVYQILEPRPKRPAAEYFQISNAALIEYHSVNPDNITDFSRVLIAHLSFNITAVQGDATAVQIITGGNAEPNELPYWQELYKGQTEYAEVTFDGPFPPGGLLAEKTADGYPVKLKISSNEAAGDILVNFTAL